MIRSLTLLTLVSFAFSCGKLPDAVTSGTIGQYRDAVVVDAGSDLKSSVMGLCQLLNDKNSYFRTLHVGAKFNFKTSLSSCSKEIPDRNATFTNSDVKTQLNFNGTQLYYSLLSGINFNTQVETSTSGAMSVLCRDVLNLKSPMKISEGLAVWYSVTTVAPNVKVIKLETGLKQNDGRFLVSVIDSFKVDYTAGPLVGMVLEHQSISGNGCSDSKVRELTSTFVNKE
ncbi:MAG: hypothetical protein K2P81_08575 [Bacteriovoracaceae bacterium]|nr:hypothetical protein [Bacteriovoracaceae bacterium]